MCHRLFERLDFELPPWMRAVFSDRGHSSGLGNMATAAGNALDVPRYPNSSVSVLAISGTADPNVLVVGGCSGLTLPAGNGGLGWTRRGVADRPCKRAPARPEISYHCGHYVTLAQCADAVRMLWSRWPARPPL